MTILNLKNVKFKINVFLLVILGIYIYFGYLTEITVIILTVTMHEISHVLAANKLDVKVKEFEIFPFGGVAKLDSIIGPDPNIEIKVALVGPMVNFLLALIFMLINHFLSIEFIELLLKCNFYMGVFNLLPILPLDGGRILRGVLSYVLGFRKATRILTYIAYGFSVLFIILGTYIYSIKENGLYIILIAIFLFIAANKEKRMAAFIFIKEVTEKKQQLLKKRVMKTQHLIVFKSAPVNLVLKNFLPKKFHIIIIIDDNGNIIGTINEIDLLNGAIEYGIDIKIENLLIKKKK
ncbi:M50 family metallopeptidase [Caldisalinibacter kiritimatiensis]|uniref:Zn-dependent protease n=1 Tax=Caldisalinibacter kiritimatiensis TaxID=1304284 RepID=R1CSZ0_9FIRM|nr:M50 family metallopeptidase [Caldisalinibacter kiritimatiensis]EOC99818.1 Zn-dependent protease [Caldisalinibacter kiritimatiensis]